jgi:RND family efflux transporter MFP subunit
MANARRSRSRHVWVFAGIALVVVIAVAGYLVYRGVFRSSAAQVTYTTAAVQKMTLTSSVSGTGNASLSATASVNPTASGTVSGLSLAVGDKVNEGDVLFRVVDPQLDVNVANAQSAYDKAGLGVSQANLNVQQAELSLSQIELQYYNQSTTTTAPPQTSTTGHPSTTSTTRRPVPIVTGVSPSAGPITGGTSVTITGSDLTGATAVNFGDIIVTGFTVVDSSHVTAPSPAHQSGTVDVTVTTPKGTSATSASDQFAYVLPPTVTGISPDFGNTGGGTIVTITGTGFTGATAVNFGATAATSFAVDSATSITAVSPAQGPGTVDVIVATAGGTSATSSADLFSYSTTTTKASATLTLASSGADTTYLGPMVLLAAQTGSSTGNTISTLDIKAAKQAVTSAQLSVTAAQIQLNSAKVALDSAKSAAAERTVTAPMSGTVTALSIANGDTVSGSAGGGSSTSGSGVVTITNLDLFQATVALAETDISGVKPGQKAVLTFTALPNLTLSGKVTSIETSGTNNQGVVSYNVVVTPDATDPSVKGGMTVTVNIITDVHADVLTVPNAAVKTSTNGSYVQVLQNGKPVEVTVEVGISTSSDTEITSGLTEGQEVITATINPNASTTTTVRRGGTGGLGGGGLPGGGVIRGGF